MQTEAEILTDHNELICSTSVECIVTGRNAALKEIEALTLNLTKSPDWLPSLAAILRIIKDETGMFL